MWLRILGLAACYFVVAQLSLLMAIPPGYAAAFWPAAGIALAAMLVFGTRIWPGVLLGSFLANVGTKFDGGSMASLSVSLLLPMAIGVGATLQALLGAWLVRRYVGFPSALNREQDVASLFLLAGPFCCCINATVGVLSVWLAAQWEPVATTQSRAPVDLLFSWWVWWIGDTIGVFVVTPVALLWASPARADWQRRALTVSVPLSILAALVVALYVEADSREKQRMQSDFEFQTKILTQALENRIEFMLQGLTRVHSFHGSRANDADREKYERTAQNLTTVRSSVNALAWTPRIREAERSDFEKQAGFEIRELAGEAFVPAQPRAEYFPILYRHPPRQNLYGFDVACEAERLAALTLAGINGEPVASAPITHLKDADKKNLLIFLPIYRDNVVPVEIKERPAALVGYVIAVIRFDLLIDSAWGGYMDPGIDFWLFDENAAPANQIVIYRGGQASTSEAMPIPVDDRHTRTSQITAAGRTWKLRFAQTPAYFSAHRSLQAWVLLAGGMLCTGLLGAVLLVATGRAELVAAIVDERTAELAQANAAMKQEIADRNRAEESLRQSEERFRFLVEGTTDYSMLMLDLAGRVVTWNAGAERIQGYKADEIVGKSFAHFFTEQDVARGEPKRILAMAARTGRSEDEGWRVRKDGSRFWVHAVVTPFRDAEGNLKGYWKIVRDLTERKQTEEKFRGLLESAPDAVVIVQGDGTITLVNRRTEQLFGFARAELIGKPIEILVPPPHRQLYADYRADYFAHPDSAIGPSINLFGVRKDGSEFPVEINLSPLVTEEGILVSSAIRDITRRRVSEAALEETRRFIQRIAEMTPSILYVYDVQEECNIFVNHRLETILGYAWEDNQKPRMPTVLQDVHPDDRLKAERAYEECQIADDGAVIEAEYRVRHANGDWRWLNSRNTVFVRDREGNATQILGTATDITDRKRLEQEVLEIATSEQRRIGQELHDGTGQQLTGLCMLADNLADALRGPAPEAAETARRIAQGLQETLGQVRSVVARGLILVEVDAEGLMAALTEMAARISELHSVQCVFECARPVPLEDNFTATQLYRIAQEAITNALKHGRPSHVRVTLETRSDYITLKIADDGIGLPNTLDPTQGMGLRIMRYRAGQIGAYITIRPGPASGTIVACTLFRGSIDE